MFGSEKAVVSKSGRTGAFREFAFESDGRRFQVRVGQGAGRAFAFGGIIGVQRAERSRFQSVRHGDTGRVRVADYQFRVSRDMAGAGSRAGVTGAGGGSLGVHNFTCKFENN